MGGGTTGGVIKEGGVAFKGAPALKLPFSSTKAAPVMICRFTALRNCSKNNESQNNDLTQMRLPTVEPGVTSGGIPAIPKISICMFCLPSLAPGTLQYTHKT